MCVCGRGNIERGWWCFSCSNVALSSIRRLNASEPVPLPPGGASWTVKGKRSALSGRIGSYAGGDGERERERERVIVIETAVVTLSSSTSLLSLSLSLTLYALSLYTKGYAVCVCVCVCVCPSGSRGKGAKRECHVRMEGPERRLVLVWLWLWVYQKCITFALPKEHYFRFLILSLSLSSYCLRSLS